jgi:hypothetical protein
VDVAKTADALLENALQHGQSVLRVDGSTPLRELRAAVRAAARRRAVSIRTGSTGDLLAVVMRDAALWDEDTATMCRRLTAPDEPNTLA